MLDPNAETEVETEYGDLIRKGKIQKRTKKPQPGKKINNRCNEQPGKGARGGTRK